MSEQSPNNNPFFGLFTSSGGPGVVPQGQQPNAAKGDPLDMKDTNKEVVNIIMDSESPSKPQPAEPPDEETVLVNQLAEDIFHLTIDKDNKSIESGRVSQLVYLEDIAASAAPSLLIGMDILKLAIFERLFLQDPSQHIILGKKRSTSAISVSHVIQKECIIYLFECYKRLKECDVCIDVKNKIIGFVVENAATALSQPILFESQQIPEQVLLLFNLEEGHTSMIGEFLREVAEVIHTEEGDKGVENAIRPVLAHIQVKFVGANVINFSRPNCIALGVFASIPHLAKAIMEFTKPLRSTGSAYASTLLGSLLNLSCLPKTQDASHIDYFEKPLDGGLNAVERNLWSAISEVCERTEVIVTGLLRHGPRNDVIAWLGGCLDANSGRVRLASLGIPPLDCVSDGFAINLASLLLRLCAPFTRPEARNKLYKIDPTYSAASRDNKSVHWWGLQNEPCLQPSGREEGEKPRGTADFSLATEMLHLAARAVELGPGVVMDLAHALFQEIGRLQTLLAPDPLSQRLHMLMSRYLCLRCALVEPTMMEMMAQFSVAVSSWLIQVIIDPTPGPRDSYAPIVERQLPEVLPDPGPATLRCIPELMVECIGRWLRISRSYSPECMEVDGVLEPVLTLLVALIGSAGRARNPHLRAALAQGLEAMLPRPTPMPVARPVPSFYRERLFAQHPHARLVVPALLEVFVSIEMTGQSVAFEHKFNYRRPMYAIMDYLWTIPLHRRQFRRLADEAEAAMEETNPPLMLRFLNLLMNDAVFLLDEALGNMAALRRLETEPEGTSTEERRERIRQIGATARFDNILGSETIHALEYLSAEVQSLLCHPTLVDRVAAMLNYFLHHLVGPKKKNFKVKDQAEYKFEPGKIVVDICKIYSHLGGSDAFCQAISRDGRSYSPHLFANTLDVLARVGGGVDLVSQVEQVGRRVGEMAEAIQTEEELLVGAPDEFLDPIMSTLMTDPVTLPSSRVNIDRATIARHLLSDQSDPFNRSPLTMSMVQSNTELKAAIEAWVAEKKAAGQK